MAEITPTEKGKMSWRRQEMSTNVTKKTVKTGLTDMTGRTVLVGNPEIDEMNRIEGFGLEICGISKN